MTEAYLEVDDVKRLERAATCLRDRLLIRVLFHLGCRVSEALNLEAKSVDFSEGTLTIEHLKARIRLSCPQCRARLGKDHIFCPRCGARAERTLPWAKGAIHQHHPAGTIASPKRE